MELRDAECQALYQHLRTNSTAMAMASSLDSLVVHTVVVRTRTMKTFEVPPGIIDLSVAFET